MSNSKQELVDHSVALVEDHLEEQVDPSEALEVLEVKKEAQVTLKTFSKILVLEELKDKVVEEDLHLKIYLENSNLSSTKAEAVDKDNNQELLKERAQMLSSQSQLISWNL